MFELYIGNKNYSSWSLRSWVLLKALGIPVTEHLRSFRAGGSPEFRSFSPSGRVPCLHDGGAVVWDSLGIAEYVAEKHPGVWPADPAARAWARCAAAEMHSGFGALRNRCTMNCGVRVRLAGVPPDLATDLARIDQLWNEGLTRFGGPFLAGLRFTAADAFYAPVVLRAQTYGLSFTGPAGRYVEHMLALPALRAWYDAGIAETWREPGHDAELQASGTLLQDLRAKA